jgi:hypothetical protein
VGRKRKWKNEKEYIDMKNNIMSSYNKPLKDVKNQSYQYTITGSLK